jgi:pimeloyl-ACP methyl ester carboxylesterase
MKKLIIIVFFLSALAVLLVILAFLCLDLAGHRVLLYEVYENDKLFGAVKVDRYVTEDKIVYKSSTEYPHSLGYPSLTEKLFLKKYALTPLRFTEEAAGVKGQKRMTLIVQNEDRTDLLFLEHPRFITLKGYETGEKTMLFSPRDIMLYMPVMEKYNYWKKGAQFFEIMIPTGEALPPMRDKLEVRYLKDEYIPIMGRRVEAESFSLSAKALPEARIFMAKYSRRVFMLDLPGRKLKFKLVGYNRGPGEKMQLLIERSTMLIEKAKAFVRGRAERAPAEKTEEKPAAVPAKTAEKAFPKESTEIFFESRGLILSGRLWTPPGSGPFPAALILPKDGPLTAGEESMLNALAGAISSKGFVVLVFDRPGQGKSQGAFSGNDDEKNVRDITVAISHLENNPKVRRSSISIIGHEGGGYLGLKAAEAKTGVRSCMILGMPSSFEKHMLSDEGAAKDALQKLLAERGFGAFADDYMKKVAGVTREHLQRIIASNETVSYFMGITLPDKEYRDFIERKPYETIISFQRPLLFIVARDDRYFDPKVVDRLKASLAAQNKNGRIAEFRILGPNAGSMAEKEGKWTFVVNNDVVTLMEKWLKENGIAPEEKAPEEAGGKAPGAEAGNIALTQAAMPSK